jgi:hypothetical protein
MDDLNPKRAPACFAAIEKVFPMGPGGLRQTPPECLSCAIKTDCLRSALAGEQGVAVHEERLARAYQGGSVGFLARWAQQKNLEHRKKTHPPWWNFWRRFRQSAR